jgi:hypothetical protein
MVKTVMTVASRFMLILLLDLDELLQRQHPASICATIADLAATP